MLNTIQLDNSQAMSIDGESEERMAGNGDDAEAVS
jgi:hypothetical protein